MMPFVGKALQRGARPQVLTAFGFVFFFLFTWKLSHSTLSSGVHDFFWPLVFRGIGMALLFVPLTTLALGSLRGKDIPQGAGLTNMMRQLGGSFGVAIIATYIQQRVWSHRGALLGHLSIYDPAVRERLQAITHGLEASGSAHGQPSSRPTARSKARSRARASCSPTWTPSSSVASSSWR
jgi:DHA2 family multidrug resistance protein